MITPLDKLHQEIRRAAKDLRFDPEKLTCEEYEQVKAELLKAADEGRGVKMKRGPKPEPKRHDDGSLRLTPAERRIMANLLKRYRRAPLSYDAWWDHNLSQMVAQKVGLNHSTVSRFINNPAIRADYLRRTMLQRRRTPGDRVADLVMRLEFGDALGEDFDRDEAKVLHRLLQDDQYEEAIRRWLFSRTSIK